MWRKFLREFYNYRYFFKDDVGNYSMGRLVTFLITVTICFDCFYTLLVLNTVWDLSAEKMFLAVVAITGKVSSLYFERKNYNEKH